MSSELASMPQISGMIPSCDRAHFLPATIERAVAQTFDDFDLKEQAASYSELWSWKNYPW